MVRRVVEEGAYSNLALAAALGRAGLDARDRRLAADLAYGTLRAIPRLDPVIASHASRSFRRIDPIVLAVLRLGAYQVLMTRIPPHAAVSETVSLAPPRSRGFVNAVLRRVAAAPPAPAPEGDDDEAVAARGGVAVWWVAELRRLLPPEEVEPAAAALASATSLCLRTNPARSSPEALLEALSRAGVAAEPARWAARVVRVDSAAPASLPGYEEGWFAVQDEASALVGEAAAISPGERVLDVCAGPGGKTADLAARAAPNGLVVAGDRSPARARLVGATAARLGVPVRVLAQDARRPALRPDLRFDVVLVDAPCSGLGASRRRPELLWRPRPESASGLAALQADILDAAAAFVGPGGRLLYSVCTFPVEETDAVAEGFAERHPEFEPLPSAGPDGVAARHRLWPHRHGTDGMFWATYRRVGELAR